jgi:hypothetical protein
MSNKEAKELIEDFRSKYGELIDSLTFAVNTMIAQNDGDNLAIMLIHLDGLVRTIQRVLPPTIDARGAKARDN